MMMTQTLVNPKDMEAFIALGERMRAMKKWGVIGAPGTMTSALALRFNRTSRPVGHFASRKMAVRLPYVSSLERDLLYLLETDPEVTGYLTQPGRIRYLLDGDIRSHYPDCFMLAGTDLALVEVKHADDAAKVHVKTRTQLMKRELARYCIKYAVLTEETIRLQPRLRRARSLSRFRAHTPDPSVVLQVRELLRQQTAPKQISEIMNLFRDPTVAAQSIFAAILRGELQVTAWAPRLEESALGPDSSPASPERHI